MKIIKSSDISSAVKQMCIQANCIMNPKIYSQIKKSVETETNYIAKDILKQLLTNSHIAEQEMIPLCQDTGSAVVFIELGQEVYVEGNLEEAIHEGVRQGYKEGYLRKSIVEDPLLRINTQDNTPAVIHYEIKQGNNLKITVAPKGGGSENASKLYMLNPSEGISGIKKALWETIVQAGPNPCPPLIIGIGIGGNFEKAAFLSKKALLREPGTYSSLPHIKNLEMELLTMVNETDVGVQGLGGNTTALFVAIEAYPCHIASLPLAINVGCHATRHLSITL